jgi:hypothetical protein
MMKQKQSREFPEFGVLNHVVGSNWSSDEVFSFLGKSWSVPVSVSIGTSGLEHNQLLARKAFDESSNDIISETENAIIKYMHSQVEHPELRQRRNLDDLVKLVGVHFPRGRENPTWGMLLDCTWDDRGIAVEVVGSRIMRVGTQDIVL